MAEFGGDCLQEILKQCTLLDYNFGFLGEIYIEPQILYEVDVDFIGKYFSWKKPYFCSRNYHYYESDINVIFGYIFEYENDINEIVHLNMNEDDKRCILFCILSHLLNDMSKILGILFSYKNLRSEFYRTNKELLQAISDFYIGMIFNSELIEFHYINKNFFERMLKMIEGMDGIRTREYSEMDHPLILIKSYMVYYEYIKGINLFVSPLQGASLIPTVYVSLAKLIGKKEGLNQEMNIEYVRYSNYDSLHYIDVGIDEQIMEILRYNGNIPLILIDDNVGTGTTLENLVDPLRRVFDTVYTGVIECRWDTKMYHIDYPAFDMNKIDLITPLEYRHYGIIDEEIAYIRMSNKLSEKYKDVFYNLEFVYDECDFVDYLNNSEIKRDKKIRLLDIVSKYKKIESYECNFKKET